MTISVWWNVGNADTQHKGSNSKAGTSWIHWHESHLVFRPSISSDFIWNALKKCFIRACRYLFRPSALFLPSVLKTHTHMHSSQTDMLKTLRCVLRMLQLYSGTLWNPEGDTWESANMSFLPRFLGVHCELPNLLHGKTPNLEAKERPRLLIRLTERQQALTTELWRLKDGARIMWETWRFKSLGVCGNV